MLSRKKKKKKQLIDQEQLNQEILREIYGIILLTLAFITIASYGAIGRNLAYLSRLVVGTFDFVIPLSCMIFAFYVVFKKEQIQLRSPRFVGALLVFISILALNHLMTFQAIGTTQGTGYILEKTWDLLLKERTSPLPTDVGSGMVGAIVYALLYFLFDNTGTMIVLGALALAGILLITGFSYVNVYTRFWEKVKMFCHRGSTQIKDRVDDYLNRRYGKDSGKRRVMREDPEEDEAVEVIDTSEVMDAVERGPERPKIHDFQERVYDGDKEAEQLKLNLATESTEEPAVQFQTEQKDLPHYKLPALSLLEKPRKRKSGDKENIKANAEVLVRTLQSFGVQAKVTAIHRGPTVTRYEIQPEIGVKVSRVVNLSDDIALALAARDIRIEAPIPGKSAIGIEVPNAEIATVHLRDVLESASYQSEPSKLTISLGMDISGQPIVANLAKMPHLLVAGATGSGKSVCINAMIVSLLYRAKPDEVKLMMIDPKMVELNIYNGIPHLLAPVVTDPRKASVALKKIVAEMENRYELFAKNGARDIERYNQMVEEQQSENRQHFLLPYIVVIVDELADLMTVAPANVEDSICRLAQMARAAGIHLIIATQRPSVDVITGVIKANIPSRIAFAVSSNADSRTILDMAGADKLLGYGDMLYLPVGAPKPIRIQGTFLSDEEVERVVTFVKHQQEANYVEDMIPSSQDIGTKEELADELYPQAVRLVLEAKTASVSLIQRRLPVGYTRAARLIDMMENNGVIGPYEGSKPREVLITLEQFEKRV